MARDNLATGVADILLDFERLDKNPRPASERVMRARAAILMKSGFSREDTDRFLGGSFEPLSGKRERKKPRIEGRAPKPDNK